MTPPPKLLDSKRLFQRSPYIKQYILVTLIALAIASCKRANMQSPSKPQMISSNLILDVKSKVGVDLPSSCRLILITNSPRLDSDIWLFEIDGSNPARFPRQLELQPQVDGEKIAKVMERLSGISLGIPKTWYFGIWQGSNAQCHATLITTSNDSQFLMLERLY